MSLRLAPLAAALLAASALPAPALATDVTAADAAPAEADPDGSAPVSDPGVMVITSTSLTAPVTVQVDLKLPRQPLPAHDGADYLKTIPGFSVTRKGGADGDPVFRGQGGSRLNILTDGQAVLGGCNSRMDAPTAYIYPEAYDVLTVVKGPQSVQYGPVASAGTVLFERSDERFTATAVRLYAAATVASFGRQDLVLDARMGAPTGYVALQGSDSRANDYEDGNGVPVHSQYQRYNAGAAVGWTPDDDTLVELSATHSDGEAAYADRSMDGTRFRREATALRLERKHLSPLLEALKLSAFTSTVDHVMDDQELRTPGTMGYANLLRDTEGGRIASAWRVAAPSLLTVGADWQENAHAARSAMPGMPYSPLVEDARFRQYGVFAELEQELSAQQKLIAGYRSDRWQATDARALIPRMMPMPPLANPTAGLTRRDSLESAFVRLEQQLQDRPVLVYAGVGHAERFPDYWELISKQAAASASGFMSVAPEVTDQLDMGALWQGDALKASASVFYGRIGDYILVDYNVKMQGGTRNVEARTWGGELGADYRVAPHWTLNSTLSYVRGQNVSDDRDLPQQPPLEARLGLAWDNRVWSAGLLGRFVAEQDRVARGEGTIVGKDLGASGDFTVVSANAGWRPLPALLVSVGVDNLLDTVYAEFISRSGDNGMGMAIPGYAPTVRVNEPGRTAWLKVSYTLK
ncbi:MAG: TonB-dependent copper receptor [Pseudomonadota bacterium]